MNFDTRKSKSDKPADKAADSKVKPAKAPEVKEAKTKGPWWRGFLAFLLGSLAFYSLIACVFSYWMNHTLTNSKQFAAIMGQVEQNSSVQGAIAGNIASALTKDVSTPDLKQKFLPKAPATTTPQEIRSQSNKIIQTSIQQILAAPQFEKLWQDTMASTHEQLISQLKETDPNKPINVNIQPLILGVIGEVKKTQLAFIVPDKLPQDMGKFEIKNSSNTGKTILIFNPSQPVTTLRNVYQKMTMGLVAAIALAVTSTGLMLLVSNRRWHALRRLSIFTGLTTFLIAIMFAEGPAQVSQRIKFNGADPNTSQAVVAVLGIVTRELRQICIAVTVICFVAAVGISIMLMERHHKRIAANKPAAGSLTPAKAS